MPSVLRKVLRWCVFGFFAYQGFGPGMSHMHSVSAMPLHRFVSGLPVLSEEAAPLYAAPIAVKIFLSVFLEDQA